MKKLFRENKKPLIIALCGTLFFILPLVLLNFTKDDDHGRVVGGYYFNFDKRYMSTFLMKILQFDFTPKGSNPAGFVNVDIFPAPLILGTVLLVTVTLLVVRKFKLTDNAWLLAAIALFPLYSPFIIANLLYRYDALPMLVSIIFPLLTVLTRHKNNWVNFGITFGLAMLTWLSYQAAISIFPIMILIEGVYWFNNGTLIKDGTAITRYWLARVGGIMLSALVFLPIIKVAGGYAAKANSFTFNPQHMLHQGKLVIQHFITAATEFNLVLTIVFAGILLLALSLIIKRQLAINQSLPTYLWSLLVLVSPLLVFLVIAIPLFATSLDVVRSYIAVSIGMLYFILILLMAFKRKFIIWTVIALVTTFSFSKVYAVSNALRYSNNVLTNTYENIINDLDETQVDAQTLKVHSIGDGVNKHIADSIAFKKFPTAVDFIGDQYDSTTYFGVHIMKNLAYDRYVLELAPKLSKPKIKSILQHDLIIERKRYKLYFDQNKQILIIDWNLTK
ncbi:MAG: glucosyltransferase domain-containing protein [Lactobacillaceae bacterium]|nr:glucosyltransferase domain-containing protein [Lactobacillaceae bacterium]